MNRKRKVLTLGLTFTVWGALGCGKQAGTAGPAPDQVPASTSIQAASLTAGYAIGRLNATYAVTGFRITAEPIRVREYQQCVDAGACSPPSLDVARCAKKAPAPDGESAIACATPKEATQYCAWQKGALPDEQQWLLAARGTVVHRWAWGDTAPTCDQHPLGKAPTGGNAGCGTDPTKIWVVGQHPAGASPQGLRDVLLTPAELLRTTADTISSTCSGQPGDGVCLVVSLAAGAIDAARSISTEPSSTELSTTPAYSFRCVWTDS
jgi:hypothetical protein